VIHSSLAARAIAHEILTAADRPIVLLLDVGGASPDAADPPDRIVVPAELVSSPAVTERRLEGALALISGREFEEIGRLFQPLKLSGGAAHRPGLRFEFGPGQSDGPGRRRCLLRCGM
jgi:trehalose-6-phosphatase